ncbi:MULTISPECIES: hypothetical protein [Haloferax]|uniref:DUF8144 domain-containing protein n=1 Tax=Haloferax massiliensis TaxID=1476858 RepID=A0A0D6JW48_9EURY|nr:MULTISPECIES: hypothetical protein [Haloferax]MDS0240899.1 hypothetical protein [Haloferax sp. S2CR25]MDS0444020.1 hypothetical protein [Haloferax sp. S2CR25-2]CQR53543.1 hypothetical protein BN996_03665 [Haloferax massiliensis]
MAERTMVEFVEEWQRGAFLLFGSALAGGVSAVFVGSLRPGTPLGLITFFVGSVLAFLAFSYLFYGE